MVVRAFEPKDMPELQEILGERNDISPNKDFIVVVEQDGHVVGVVASRPVCLIHSLCIARGTLMRRVAEMALAYKLGMCRAQGAREAMFLVEQNNEAMRRFLEDQQATRETQSDVYAMEIR